MFVKYLPESYFSLLNYLEKTPTSIDENLILIHFLYVVGALKFVNTEALNHFNEMTVSKLDQASVDSIVKTAQEEINERFTQLAPEGAKETLLSKHRTLEGVLTELKNFVIIGLPVRFSEYDFLFAEVVEYDEMLLVFQCAVMVALNDEDLNPVDAILEIWGLLVGSQTRLQLNPELYLGELAEYVKKQPALTFASSFVQCFLANPNLMTALANFESSVEDEVIHHLASSYYDMLQRSEDASLNEWLRGELYHMQVTVTESVDKFKLSANLFNGIAHEILPDCSALKVGAMSAGFFEVTSLGDGVEMTLMPPGLRRVSSGSGT